MEPIRTVDNTMPPKTLGWEMLAWSADNLVQPDGPHAGEPLTFTNEQARIILNWYALDPAGRFMYRRGVLRRMKGHGKDPLGAALALFELCGPCRFDSWGTHNPVGTPHPAPLVQVVAVSLTQTKTTMSLFPAMLAPDALVTYGVDVGFEIIRTASGGRIEAVTSSPRALEGARPSFALMNETEHWLASNFGHEMARVVSRNLAKGRDGSARSLELANAHLVGEDSVAEQTFEAWRQADGRVEGLYYDSLEAPPIDLADPDVVRQAVTVARGDSWWVDVDRITAEILDPVTRVSEARRYYLNQLTNLNDEQAWITPAAWDACADPNREVPDGDAVIVGFDGSYSGDATAAIGLSVAEIPHVFVIALWEPLPDAEVDIEDVERVLLDAGERYKVLELVADPFRWARSLQICYNRGLPVCNFPQTASRMSPATARFSAAVNTRTITHSGDPRLRQHVLNAVLTSDSRGARIQKLSKRSPHRIDAAVCAVMALDRFAQSEDVAPELRRQERQAHAV